MIESSYQPINGENPLETNQPLHRRILQKIRNIDKSFIVSKLFYFFFYTALGALFPFFSLYYKQLWLSPSQIGILLALRPTVKLICLPLWKMVTDKYSKPKAVYFISIFGWLIGYYGQTLVAPDDITCYYRNITTASVQSLKNNSHLAALNASLLKMASSDWSKNQFDMSTYPEHKLNFKTFHDNKVIMRALYSNPRNSILKLSKTNDYKVNHAIISQNVKLKSPMGKQMLHDNKVMRKIGHEREFDNKDNEKQIDPKEVNFIASDESKGISFQSKWMPFITQGENSPKPDKDFRIRYNYWIIRTLAVIIILTEIITTPTPMLADSAVIHSLADTDNDYGKQRLFGCLGLALSAALVAVWVSNISHCLYTDTINYIPCFNIFLAAIGATVIVSLFFKFETPERSRDEDNYELLEAVKIFKSPRYGFFLFTMFTLGFAHSVQITFLFWFLQDIGGTPVLFAFMILVYCISEVVMYFVLGYIIDAIGTQRTLAIAIACYTVRFLMYGSLKHPWLVIPMELVQGMTYGGVWTVAGMYIKAPEGKAQL